jgi:hypothetical protein
VLEVNGISLHVEITAAVNPYSCCMDGRTLQIFGATRSHSSSRTASAQSRRTCVASEPLNARREWLRIPWRTGSAMSSAFLTGSTSTQQTSLNWYRANLAPRMPEPSPTLPPVEAPTLGVWSTNDYYLDGERMKISDRFIKGALALRADRWRQPLDPARRI